MSHGQARSHSEKGLHKGTRAGGVLPVDHSLPTMLAKAHFRVHTLEKRQEALSTASTILAALIENWNVVWDAKSLRDLVITVQMEQVLVITCQAFHQCRGHSVTVCFSWPCSCPLPHSARDTSHALLTHGFSCCLASVSSLAFVPVPNCWLILSFRLIFTLPTRKEFTTTSLVTLQPSKIAKSSHRLYMAFGQTPTPDSSSPGQDDGVSAERQTVNMASAEGIVSSLICLANCDWIQKWGWGRLPLRGPSPFLSYSSPSLPFLFSSLTPEADPDSCHQIIGWTSVGQVPPLVMVAISLTHMHFSLSMLYPLFRISQLIILYCFLSCNCCVKLRRCEKAVSK